LSSSGTGPALGASKRQNRPIAVGRKAGGG